MASLKEYLLIKFVPETATERRKPYVDCTRSDWVFLCPKRSHLVTKFMGPPYDEESNSLLESLLKSKADAPEDWPTFPIEVKGQADTYEEAMKKVARLEVTEFVFTTDSDFDHQQKAALIENNLKTKKLNISDSTLKAMQSVQPLESDSENWDPENSEFHSDSDASNMKQKNKSKKTKRQIEKKRKSATPVTKCAPSLKKSKTIDEPSPNIPTSSKIEKLQSSSKIERQVDLRCNNYMMDLDKNDSKYSDTRCTKNASDKETEVIDVQEFGNRDNHNAPKYSIIQKKRKRKRSTLSDDLPLLLSALKGLAIDNQEILANQRMILHHLGKTDTAKEKLFNEKHRLNVPFQSDAQFMEFDEKLKTDDDFRTEFAASLSYLFDRELNVSKTLTNIFKKYLSRRVMAKYTAKRKVIGKKVMKESTFYECVSDSIMQTHRRPDSSSRPLTEDMVCNALGKIFNNAKDWEGERQKRASAA